MSKETAKLLNDKVELFIGVGSRTLCRTLKWKMVNNDIGALMKDSDRYIQ